VLIIAALIVGAMFCFISVASWSQTVVSQQKYTVLNDALTRYKGEGGNINALTVGAPWSDVITTLQTPVVWAGVSHQFLNSGFTCPGRSISVVGSGQQYQITRYNSFTSQAGGFGPGTITNGLVGWWKLDGVNGATDLSGNGNSGSAQGGVVIRTAVDHKGNANGATSFNGSSNYVDVGNNGDLNFTSQDFTISAWVNWGA
jgi:hypothetical protein